MLKMGLSAITFNYKNKGSTTIQVQAAPCCDENFTRLQDHMVVKSVFDDFKCPQKVPQWEVFEY